MFHAGVVKFQGYADQQVGAATQIMPYSFGSCEDGKQAKFEACAWDLAMWHPPTQRCQLSLKGSKHGLPFDSAQDLHMDAGKEAFGEILNNMAQTPLLRVVAIILK